MAKKTILFFHNPAKEADKYYLSIKKVRNKIWADQCLLRASSANDAMPELFSAIQYDSEKASDLLIQQILAGKIGKKDSLFFVFQKLRGLAESNKEAAYVLAYLYAGKFIDTENLQPTLELNQEEREQRAIRYAKQAIALGSDSARVFLTTAYATGQRGCIKSSVDAWLALNEELINKGNQNAALDLGCYYLGVLHDGKPLTQVSDLIKIQLPYNEKKGLGYLCQASRGSNLSLAYKAIARLCDSSSMSREALWELFDHEIFHHNNQLVAFYLAFCACPDNLLCYVPDCFFPPRTFQFSEFTGKSLKTVEQYLSQACRGDNVFISMTVQQLNEALQKLHLTSTPSFNCK